MNKAADNFKIDFEEKKITYIGKGGKIYSAKELYAFLQDTFDEPENMKYDIPIVAKSRDKFELINGWSLEEKALKHLTGATINLTI